MRLRFKFNLVITAACALGIGAAAGLSYWVVQKSAMEEVAQQIRLLRANALAVRSYTVESIDPLLSEDNDILFLPQSVTAYAATSVFATFRKDFPEYFYKEAALNPTNPANNLVTYSLNPHSFHRATTNKGIRTSHIPPESLPPQSCFGSFLLFITLGLIISTLLSK